MLPDLAGCGQLRFTVRYAVALILLLVLVVAGSLLAATGGRDAGMILFAISVVIVLSVLPVIGGRLVSRRPSAAKPQITQTIVPLNNVGLGQRPGEDRSSGGYPPERPTTGSANANHHQSSDQ